MKKRILALFVLILFSLSSCSKENITNVSCPSSPMRVFLEIPQNIKYGEAFDVRIGFYLPYSIRSDEATLSIYADNFEIILPDGSRFEDRYTFEYSNFDDPKYGFIKNEETKESRPKYYESFSLVYVGPDNYLGVVAFSVQSPALPDHPVGGILSSSVQVYYKIRWKYIRWNINRPFNFESGPI